MNYSKQLVTLALLISGAMAFGMQQQIPTSSLPMKPAAQDKPVARETQSTETALLFNAISKANDKKATPEEKAQAVHEVEKLLSESKDVKALANAFDSKGWSALMRAVSNDKIVYLLIKRGAAVNQANTAGIPPLREAMIAGNIDSIKHLVRENADVNHADNYGITPLMMAVSQGPADAARILIEAGADVNAEDKGGQTVWKYSTFSSPRKVSAEQKAEIQSLLEEKGARKVSLKTGK